MDIAELIKAKEGEDKSKYINEEICRKCCGNCCKNMGCCISPEDIVGGVTEENIRKLLDTGCVSIDYWEGAFNDFHVNFYEGYYLRMRNINSEVCDPAWGGNQCMMFTPDGCKLSYEHRPKEGRLLIPHDDPGKCVGKEYTKKMCVEEWLPYHDILDNLWGKY